MLMATVTSRLLAVAAELSWKGGSTLGYSCWAGVLIGMVGMGSIHSDGLLGSIWVTAIGRRWVGHSEAITVGVWVML